MPSSLWLYQLALGGCLSVLLLIAPALGQEAVKPEQWPAENQNTTSEPQEQPGEEPAVESPSALAPVVAAESSGGNHDGEDEYSENSETQKPPGAAENSGIWGVWGDTPAQWIMALFGIVATGISIWAVWLLKQTLKATREAVATTEASVEAMRDGNERMLRAYVCVTETEIKRENDRVIRALVYVSNSGQTPARNITSWTKIRVGDPSGFVVPENLDGGSKSTIGTGTTYTLQARTEPLSDEVWNRVWTRKAPLWVWGALSYDDIFGKERRVTSFRLRLHDIDEVLYPVFEGNEAT